MKIIFILGKYNPSRCGISDYVDLLSKELIKYGHIVGIRSFDSLRELSQLARISRRRTYTAYNFMPYAFSSIGFSGKTLHLLAKSLKGKCVHLTFHELWIGSYPGSPIKHTLIGWVQKREILKFVKFLNPSVAFGTNSAAIDRLKREGVYAQYLYLFGNIPYSPIPAGSTKECFRVAFFGTAYENFPYELLSVRLKRIKKLSKQKIELRIIGIQRDSIGLEKLRSMAQKHGFGISMTNELPPTFMTTEIPQRKELFVFEPFKDQIFLLNNPKSSEQMLKATEQLSKPFFNGVVHTAHKFLRCAHESEESIQSVPKPMAIVGSLSFGIMEIYLVFPLLMDTKVF